MQANENAAVRGSAALGGEQEQIFVKNAGKHEHFHSRVSYLACLPPPVCLIVVSLTLDKSEVHFGDGLALSDLLGSYQQDGQHYCVVPVVPPTWEMNEEVPLWAGCIVDYHDGCHAKEFKDPNGNECHKNWVDPHASSGRPFIHQDHKFFHKAIAEVEKIYGVKTAGEAPVVEWFRALGNDTEQSDTATDVMFMTSVRIAIGIFSWCAAAGTILVCGNRSSA